MFSGPNTIFNQPDSIYNNDQLPLINLLRLYPQFDGDFEGLPELVANSWYHSFQLRLERRAASTSTWKATTPLPRDRQFFRGRQCFRRPAEQRKSTAAGQLRAEYSVSANDAPQRLAAAIVFNPPVGGGLWIGHDMNRVVDAFIGGWIASTFLPEQSGPMAIGISQPFLADGNQRPNVTCSPSSGISIHQAGASMFNANCFSFPGYNQPGDAPRYLSTLRSNGIHSMDVAFYKTLTLRENMQLQLRAEFSISPTHPDSLRRILFMEIRLSGRSRRAFHTPLPGGGSLVCDFSFEEWMATGR